VSKSEYTKAQAVEYVTGAVGAFAMMLGASFGPFIRRLIEKIDEFAAPADPAMPSNAEDWETWTSAFRERFDNAVTGLNLKATEELCGELLDTMADMEIEARPAGERLRSLLALATPEEISPLAPDPVVVAFNELANALRKAYGEDWDLAIIGGDRVLAARDRSAETEIRPRAMGAQEE